jgi:hypothetical protein
MKDSQTNTAVDVKVNEVIETLKDEKCSLRCENADAIMEGYKFSSDDQRSIVVESTHPIVQFVENENLKYLFLLDGECEDSKDSFVELMGGSDEDIVILTMPVASDEKNRVASYRLQYHVSNENIYLSLLEAVSNSADIW